MFKVGDQVEVVIEHDLLDPDVTHEVDYYGPGKSEYTKHETYVGIKGNKGRWYPSRFQLVSRPTEIPKETARSNDPTTSKGKRRINKYEQEVIAQLTLIGSGTGKEIAALGQLPLNSITPRFAPLRRKGLIKDSGLRRDKQIVWVLA